MNSLACRFAFRPGAWLWCLALALAAAPARGDNPPFSIYVMKVDGSEVRKIAQSAGHDEHTCPRWSHDGTRVAFDASSGRQGKRDFFIVNADGTGLKMLGRDARPDWSVDDKQIAFDVYAPTGLEIHIQNLDGQGRTKFASGVCPRFSPDGSKLAVTDHKMLRLVDLVSGEETELLDQPFEYLFAGYNWSPDGKWLAISARVAPNTRRQMLLIGTEGQKPILLREGEQGGSVSFSPDGKQLAFDDDYKILIVDTSGGKPRAVPGQKGRNKDPHWSYDGGWIVFSSDRHLQK